MAEAEGPAEALEAFAGALQAEAPPLARVDAVEVEPIQPRGDQGFTIRASSAGARSALVPADVATCDDCLRELFDPADRRHGYALVNCTQCGPRFTIVRDVPVRPAEHDHGRLPDVRRLPAGVRGPGRPALPRGAHRLPGVRPPALDADRGGGGAARAGEIVAVKGLGGWHLACDAADEDVVARLRSRKEREDKPFAVLTGDPDALAHVSRRRARAAGLAGAPDRAAAPPAGRAARAVRRAAHRSGRTAPPLHAAAPPAAGRGRARARADQRQPLRRAHRHGRRRGPRAAGRHRGRVPRPRPAHPPPLRGLRGHRGLSRPAVARPRARRHRAPDRDAAPDRRGRRRAEEHLLRRARG